MATNLFKKYEIDQGKEKTGVDIDIEGNIFICRRAGGGNRAYRAALGMYSMEPAMRARLAEGNTPEVQLEAEDEVMLNAVADAVVLDWRNVLGRDDQPLPYSKANFIDMMRSCPDVWLRLRMEVRDVDSFRLDQVIEIGEQLGNSSAGSDATAEKS